jgi:hypothetical protein
LPVQRPHHFSASTVGLTAAAKASGKILFRSSPMAAVSRP